MFTADSFKETLERFSEICEKNSIKFHLTGGLTSIVYGEPRMTQDIDIVVDGDALRLSRNAFHVQIQESGFLIDNQVFQGAVNAGSMFQLFDLSHSVKLDVYPRELVKGELNRSIRVELFEQSYFPIASRIDVAVSKLIWINLGSQKSRRDLRFIYRFANTQEKNDIDRIANEIDLTALLTEVLLELDEL